MIVGTHLLVHLEGGAVEGICSVKANASLIAGTCLLRDHAEHLNLLDQILYTLMDMGETVDLLACKVRGYSHQILVLGIHGQIIGHGCGIDMTADIRIVNDLITL